MSNRITEKDLEAVIQRLNNASGYPNGAYTKNEEGRYQVNIGAYRLDQAYGGNRLVKMVNDGGAIRVISSGGFVPKRELYNQIYTMLNYLYAQEAQS